MKTIFENREANYLSNKHNICPVLVKKRTGKDGTISVRDLKKFMDKYFNESESEESSYYLSGTDDSDSEESSYYDDISSINTEDTIRIDCCGYSTDDTVSCG